MASLFPGDELKQRQQHQLQFTIFALDRLHQLLTELNLDKEVGLNGSGALKVLPEGTAPPSGGNRLSLEPVARIERDEALAMERSLASWPKNWSCADQETESWSGNSEKFTHAMAEHCQTLGVNMETGSKVTALQGETRVEKIITEEEVLSIGPGVEVVVAAGAWTPLLLSTMGLFCPVYPMKGYSVAMDLPPHGSSMRPAEEDLPKRMLVDGKLYVTRLGEQVRCIKAWYLGHHQQSFSRFEQHQWESLLVGTLFREKKWTRHLGEQPGNISLPRFNIFLTGLRQGLDLL